MSLIADETSDIGHHEQLSIFLRYFDETKKCPTEQFLCLKLMISVDAQSIFDKMSDVVQEYGIKWENVVSICFDGASTMSGSTGEVQAKFKEKNNRSFFGHCYGHCLNLVLVDSIGRHNIVTFNFFGNIQLVYNIIEGSCTRHAVLEKIVNLTNTKLKTLKSISTTRWACRSEAISTIKDNYSSILAAIEEISSDINLLTAAEIIEALKNFLVSMRNTEENFTDIYYKTIQMCQNYGVEIPQLKKREVSTKIVRSNNTQHYMCSKEEEMKVSVYYSTLDHMITMTVLSTAFDLNSDMLKTEINLLKHTDNIPKGEKNKCGDWINWLTQSNCGRETIFCNVFKALKTFMVISDRLDSLLTIFIEQELAYNINIDDVIDTFKNFTPVDRRMEL
ncbi:zinc finger MYM-type protein 1-like [Aphis craccivora]|uniref:Zinc finger MYM-type protein 1-like n=1 Tax=Aphis craccivora TaxID=307492 RepID=A0A6G0W1N8_APHCR|nr:zinc finger MYM-type protein 1-like [Aphis craccivora]